MYLARGTNWGQYFNVSKWRQDRHFTWSSKTRQGLAACSVKGVPSFLRHSALFLPRESNLRPSALQSSPLPTELILLQLRALVFIA